MPLLFPKIPGRPLRITSATSWLALIPKTIAGDHQLACEFAICDNWYSSLPGPTWPNRFFVHGASSAGWTDSPHLDDEVTWESIHGFRYCNGSIFQALCNAGHEWRLYNDDKNQFSDDPFGPEYGGWISQVASLHGISQLDLHSIDRFASDLNEKTC
jgi:phospholipase C